MNTAYGIIKNEYIFEGEHRISYGIAVYDAPELLGTTSVICSVPDIYSNYDAIAELVATCNRLQLSPVHLSDVIDDFLTLILN